MKSFYGEIMPNRFNIYLYIALAVAIILQSITINRMAKDIQDTKVFAAGAQATLFCLINEVEDNELTSCITKTTIGMIEELESK